jgi:N utilization substance protein A
MAGKTPEAVLAEQAGKGVAVETELVSAEDIEAAEEANSASDAFSEADAREEQIEINNDAVDTLVEESQEHSSDGPDDGPDRDGHDRG